MNTMKWGMVYFEILMAAGIFALPFIYGGGWFYLLWLGLPLPIILAIDIASGK